MPAAKGVDTVVPAFNKHGRPLDKRGWTIFEPFRRPGDGTISVKYVKF